jgi:pimeloyl-ACP methyl ester carboxylesterase
MADARTIELGPGRSLHAVQAGRGPDILLIHGALATSHDWLSGPLDALAKLGRVTAIDRPGHGRSLRPRFDGTPRAQARQMKEGLDALRIERPLIVGHSFGALVALAYAELFPAKVAQLALLSPLAFPEPRFIEHSLLAPRAAPIFGPLLSSAAEATIDPAFLRIVQEMMFWPSPVPEHWRATFPYDQVLNRDAMVAEGEETASILPGSLPGMIDVTRIAIPTTVLLGSSDKIVDHDRQGRLLARLMPDARRIELAGVGHMPHHSRPDVLIEALDQVLAAA